MRLSWRIQPQHKWLGMIVFGVMFTLAGLGLLVGAFLVDDAFVRWVMLFVAVLVLIAGITPLVFAPRARRETGTALADDLVPARARQAGPDPDTPWPVAAVASALAHELRETPYVVAHNDRAIQVTWDLGNRSWWALAQRNGTDRAFETRLVLAGPGKVTRTDHFYALDWQAGAPNLGSWQSSTGGGRVWRYERRIELGTSREGVTTPVDYTLNTKDLNDPLQAVLDRAGWAKPKLGAEAKGALIVAGIGASAVVIVPVVFLIQWLLGD